MNEAATDILPAGWSWSRLDSLIEDGPTNGMSPSSSPAANGTLSLRLSATTSGRMVLSPDTTKHLDLDVPADSKFWLEPGDLLVQRSNSLTHIGAAAIYEGPPQTYVYPDLMMRIRVADSTLGRYIWRYLNSPGARAYFRAAATGTAGNMPKINGATLRSLRVPVPPPQFLPAIVSRLDSLSRHSLAAGDALETLPTLLDRLRQSILAAAFRGDLTADWRAAHPNVEPASELLERIHAERRRRWEEAELARLIARGKSPTDDRWKAKYEEPAAADTSHLPVLPVGWCWASVDQVAVSLTYGTSAKTTDASDGIPVLRMGNIRHGRLDCADLKYLPVEHEEFPGLFLSAGDVLFNRTNSIELVGKAAAYEGEPSACSFASYLIRIRTAVLSGHLLAAFINSPSGRAWVEDVASQQVGQANISGQKLRALAVPVPPEAEGQQLVARIARGEGHALLVGRACCDARNRLQVAEAAALVRAFRKGL